MNKMKTTAYTNTPVKDENGWLKDLPDADSSVFPENKMKTTSSIRTFKEEEQSSDGTSHRKTLKKYKAIVSLMAKDKNPDSPNANEAIHTSTASQAIDSDSKLIQKYLSKINCKPRLEGNQEGIIKLLEEFFDDFSIQHPKYSQLSTAMKKLAHSLCLPSFQSANINITPPSKKPLSTGPPPCKPTNSRNKPTDLALKNKPHGLTYGAQRDFIKKRASIPNNKSGSSPKQADIFGNRKFSAFAEATSEDNFCRRTVLSSTGTRRTLFIKWNKNFTQKWKENIVNSGKTFEDGKKNIVLTVPEIVVPCTIEEENDDQ